MIKRYVSIITNLPIKIHFTSDAIYTKAIVSIEENDESHWKELISFKGTDLNELYEAIDISLYEELYGEDEFFKPFPKK